MAALVAKSLRRELRHEYIVGGRLPSEPELAEQYGVSRGTVRQALAVLEREGAIIRRQGAGTYVHYISRAQIRVEHAHEYSDLLRLAGFEPSIRLDSFHIEPLAEAYAAQLDVEPLIPALIIRKTFLANGQPAIYCIDRIPTQWILTEFADEELQLPFYDFLHDHCRLEIEQDLAEMIPFNASPDVAEALHIPPGSAILRFEDTGYDVNGVPVYLSTTYYHDNFVRFSVLRKRI